MIEKKMREQLKCIIKYMKEINLRKSLIQIKECRRSKEKNFMKTQQDIKELQASLIDLEDKISRRKSRKQFVKLLTQIIMKSFKINFKVLWIYNPKKYKENICKSN